MPPQVAIPLPITGLVALHAIATCWPCGVVRVVRVVTVVTVVRVVKGKGATGHWHRGLERVVVVAMPAPRRLLVVPPRSMGRLIKPTVRSMVPEAKAQGVAPRAAAGGAGAMVASTLSLFKRRVRKRPFQFGNPPLPPPPRAPNLSPKRSDPYRGSDTQQCSGTKKDEECGRGTHGALQGGARRVCVLNWFVLCNFFEFLAQEWSVSQHAPSPPINFE